MKRIIAILLASVMMLSMVVTVFAADAEFISPGADDFYNVVAKVKDDKGGSASTDKPTVPVGEVATLTAKEDDGFEFIGWTFTGEFDWVEGDANSKVIVIRPKSDVVFIAAFEGEGPDKDTDKESPVTGYMGGAVVMVLALSMGIAAAVYTGKKYFYGTK